MKKVIFTLAALVGLCASAEAGGGVAVTNVRTGLLGTRVQQVVSGPGGVAVTKARVGRFGRTRINQVRVGGRR